MNLFAQPVVSPLTKSSENLRLVTKIATSQIIVGYRDRHRIDVSRFFAGIEELSLWRDDVTGLSFFTPAVFGDSGFYQQLEASNPSYYPEQKTEYLYASNFIRPGSNVCEVGGGRGHFTKYINNCRYVGLEFNENAVAYAQGRGIAMLKEDLFQFSKINPEKFDVTCCFQVVEHVADPLSFIESIASMTRPGGTIILGTPNGEGYISRCRDLLNVPPHHFTWWEDMTWHWIQKHLGCANLEILHTPIDEHVFSWAQMIASDGIARMLGGELNPVVDETPLRRNIDELATQTVKIILNGLRYRGDAPALGHTTIAVFTKGMG
jgi:2-polyprenyl-3-methyl-5-hydroxy-6-metoxy-1,4-benzoquinol methylase